MLTKEDLQAIRELMKEEIDTALDVKLQPIKEDLEEIRSAVNYLAEDTDKRLKELERKIS